MILRDVLLNRSKLVIKIEMFQHFNRNFVFQIFKWFSGVVSNDPKLMMVSTEFIKKKLVDFRLVPCRQVCDIIEERADANINTNSSTASHGDVCPQNNTVIAPVETVKEDTEDLKLLLDDAGSENSDSDASDKSMRLPEGYDTDPVSAAKWEKRTKKIAKTDSNVKEIAAHLELDSGCVNLSNTARCIFFTCSLKNSFSMFVFIRQTNHPCQNLNFSFVR